MAVHRQANATASHPGINQDMWIDFRAFRVDKARRSKAASAIEMDLVGRAASILDEPFNSSNYILSHASIVRSVDTETAQGAQIGNVLSKTGTKINRKFADYWITGNTQEGINHNWDAFERRVLLASYPTFVGAYSFLEHVQIPELSKGRIIDAVARDLGSAVYIDILVANHRKHEQLVADIESGELNTLSMGANCDFTVCTECGHVAADETELCGCVKYRKGNSFYSEDGRKRITSELCGHHTLDGGGVQFIEASWVKVPAFTGAVLRNVLTPTASTTERAQIVLNSPPPQWSAKAAEVSKKAQLKKADEWDLGGDTGGEEAPAAETPAAPAKEPEADPIKDAEKELTETLVNQVSDNVKEKIKGDKKNTPSPEEVNNSSIQKEAAMLRYQNGLYRIASQAKSSADAIDQLAAYNLSMGVDIPVDLYRLALSVETSPSAKVVLARCQERLGRKITASEAVTLLRLSRFLSLCERRA